MDPVSDLAMALALGTVAAGAALWGLASWLAGSGADLNVVGQ